MVAEKQENKVSRDVGSSEKGDLKSRQSELSKKEKRNLGIILGTLCVLAAVLAVLAIVNGVQKGNKKQEPEVAEESVSEEATSKEYAVQVLDSGDPEADAAYRNFGENLQSLQMKMTEAENNNDSVAIDNAFNDYIKSIREHESSGNIGRASTLISEVYVAMERTGRYKPELLEILGSFDYAPLDEFSQYNLYDIAVKLATKLNDAESEARFVALREGVKANYEAHVRGTESYLAELNQYKQEAKQEMEGGE